MALVSRSGVVRIGPIEMAASEGTALPVDPRVRLIARPHIQSGSETTWKDPESGKIVASGKDVDRLVGWDLLMREHRDVVADGLLEIWVANVVSGERDHVYPWTYMWFPLVEWRPEKGRWGGARGSASLPESGDRGGFAVVTSLGERPNLSW